MDLENKKEMMERIVTGPNGIRRAAHVCVLPFHNDPAGVAADMRATIPPDLLPDVVFRMSTDYVMKDIDPRDETPKARKLIEKRIAILKNHFGLEMEEGGRRMQEEMHKQLFPGK